MSEERKAAQRRVAFYRDVMSRLRALPGVRAVGAVSGFPLVGGGTDGAFIILSRIDEPLVMSDLPKADEGSDAKRLRELQRRRRRLLHGDEHSGAPRPRVQTGDTPNAPHVGVISASLARLKWPNENPIGKIIQYGNMDGDLRPFTVVGVVGDVRDQNLAVDPQPTFYAYQPQRDHASSQLHVAIQTVDDPSSVIASTRSIVRQLRPDASPVLRTMESVVSTSVADRRFVLLLVGVFGSAALVLAALGVYSVISYLVTQRRQEIGVRLALGARAGDVLTLVLRQGAAMAGVGVAIGAVAALLFARLLKGLVYGVSTSDPIAFAAVIVLLCGVAVLASWMPARRAARVDPWKRYADRLTRSDAQRRASVYRLGRMSSGTDVWLASPSAVSFAPSRPDQHEWVSQRPHARCAPHMSSLSSRRFTNATLPEWHEVRSRAWR